MVLVTPKRSKHNIMISSNTTTIHDHRIHYLEAGSGTPILLLHGFAGSCEEWRPTVEFLAQQGYRAIAVDGLGFGKSDKPNDICYTFELFAEIYMRLLDTLGIDQVILVGHSFGGKCALATTVLYPQRIRRLVIADSEGFIQIPFWMRKSGIVPMLSKIFLWISRNPKMFRMQMQGTFYNPSLIPTSFEAQFRDMLYDEKSSHALIQLSKCYDYHDLIRSGMRERLGEISCPTLIIWGANDRVFTVDCAEKAHQEIRGSKCVIIPNCGHYPHIEVPRIFRGTLNGFIAKA